MIIPAKATCFLLSAQASLATCVFILLRRQDSICVCCQNTSATLGAGRLLVSDGELCDGYLPQDDALISIDRVNGNFVHF